MRTLASSCGLLGGAAWVTRAALDLAGALASTVDAVLLWSGASLLAVAVLGLGLGLVERAPLWLRAVVAVGVVALSASVLLVLHGDGDGTWVDGVVGAAAMVLSVVALVRRVRAGRAVRSRSGAPAEPLAAGTGRRAGQRRATGSHAR